MCFWESRGLEKQPVALIFKLECNQTPRGIFQSCQETHSGLSGGKWALRFEKLLLEPSVVTELCILRALGTTDENTREPSPHALQH